MIYDSILDLIGNTPMVRRVAYWADEEVTTPHRSFVVSKLLGYK